MVRWVVWLGCLVVGLLGAGAAGAQDCAALLAPTGAPVERGAPGTRLCRIGYAASHDDERRTPVWVLENLTVANFAGTWSRREAGADWKSDEDVPKAGQATDEDYVGGRYKGLGVDRGHMAPAADMKLSMEAYKQTFMFSNAVPQVGAGFNRTIWQDVEGIVRDWVCDRGRIVVVTGPIYGSGAPVLLKERVAVPDAIFKVVYDPATGKAIALIMPNQAYTIRATGGDLGAVLKPYIVSVAEVEKRTGLVFFPGLAKAQQKRIKMQASVFWGVKGGCPAGTGAEG
jgi:endonuclease G